MASRGSVRLPKALKSKSKGNIPPETSEALKTPHSVSEEEIPSEQEMEVESVSIKHTSRPVRIERVPFSDYTRIKGSI